MQNLFVLLFFAKNVMKINLIVKETNQSKYIYIILNSDFNISSSIYALSKKVKKLTSAVPIQRTLISILNEPSELSMYQSFL